MNERIQKLAEQTIGANPKYAAAMIMASPELEKFAELIISNVGKIIDDLYHALPLEQAAILLTLDEHIKEHFYGVE